MPEPPPGAPIALVVGAGIGGLAAGIALRRAGWRTRILERAAAPRELGFALNLAPNAIAALRTLGAAGPVEADGHAVGLVELRRPDGRPVKRLDVAACAAKVPSIVALRPTIHGALLAATPPQDLVLASEVRDAAASADGVRVTLGDGRHEHGDLLVGADGVGSVVRRGLHPGESPPRDSGLTAVRGVVRGVTDRLGGLSGAVYLGDGCEAATIRASADAIYWFVSVSTASVGRDGGDAATIAAQLLTRLPPAFRAVADATDPADLRVDRLVDRDPLPAWGEGRITLLGDAAHPMLPQTGQGAAQALEDAVALGAALAGVPPTGLPAALRAYEAVRIPRTSRLVRRGRRLARAIGTRSAMLDVVRNAAIRLIPGRLLAAAMLRP
jgi:2-polyprenyl-6-methoxyphenol hydroxylase-like FAD-dependent oxidoreductase